jgi:hypothetical protein
LGGKENREQLALLELGNLRQGGEKTERIMVSRLNVVAQAIRDWRERERAPAQRMAVGQKDATARIEGG